jgi:YfiH family protein
MWERIDEGFHLVGEKFEIRVSRNPISLDSNLIQTHGARVVIYKGQHKDIGDGALTDRVGVVLGVKTADCFPIFLISKIAVGVLHAGWRGSIRGIALEGLMAMYENFGVKPEEITVIFGPGICGECYEVGEEVAELFGKFAIPKGNGKYLLDLYGYNRRIFESHGVRLIVPPPACTYEDPFLFSHRRGDKGRLYNAVKMKGYVSNTV